MWLAPLQRSAVWSLNPRWQKSIWKNHHSGSVQVFFDANANRPCFPHFTDLLHVTRFGGSFTTSLWKWPRKQRLDKVFSVQKNVILETSLTSKQNWTSWIKPSVSPVSLWVSRLMFRHLGSETSQKRVGENPSRTTDNLQDLDTTFDILIFWHLGSRVSELWWRAGWDRKSVV